MEKLYPRPTLLGDAARPYIDDASVDCPDCGQPMIMIMAWHFPWGGLEQADWECRSCGHEVTETAR